MWPADQLGFTIKGDGFPRQMWQVANRLHDFAYDRFDTLVRGFHQNGEAADAFNQRGDRLAKLLFGLYQTTVPMPELAAVGNIVGAEQDIDITVKLWRQIVSWQTRSLVRSKIIGLPICSGVQPCLIRAITIL